MTWIEFLIIVLLLAVLLFLVYYYFRGMTGEVSLRRPMESRIDEYLDRRFESMIEEYSLARGARVQGFRKVNTPVLSESEERARSLKAAGEELSATIGDLDRRLDALEREMAGAK